jgi:hypothetical protein
MEVPEDIMPTINGKYQRCDCGCNVFRYTDEKKVKLKCNACSAMYSVERKEKEMENNKC